MAAYPHALMTTNIQRWQCAAYARILEERLKKLEQEDVSRHWDNPRRTAEEMRLKKKYRLKELERAKDEASETYDATHHRLEEELRHFAEEAEARKRAKIHALTLAMRDVWGCATLQEAKQIIERAVSEAHSR